MRLLSLQSFCCLVLPGVGISSCSCNCMKCFMVMAVGYSAIRAFKELNSNGKSCQLLLRDCKVFYKAFSHNRDWKSSTVVSEKLKKGAVFLAMDCKLCESETLSQYVSPCFFARWCPPQALLQYMVVIAVLLFVVSGEGVVLKSHQIRMKYHPHYATPNTSSWM